MLAIVMEKQQKRKSCWAIHSDTALMLNGKGIILNQ